ncbi:hypothetical protein HDU76_010221 [Blyttiomyces sp. JEL0837]|nr:hypothetical protein HDU76_010221 [Blyttiomyces sp. JEL0837]
MASSTTASAKTPLLSTSASGGGSGGGVGGMRNRYQRLPSGNTFPNDIAINVGTTTPGYQQQGAAGLPVAQRLPKRTTKTSQKLTLFPEDALTADASTFHPVHDEISHLSYAPNISTSTRGAAKEEFLRRVDKNSLPRVTAYCTANAYNMDMLMEYLLSRKQINGTSPRRFDEALYTPYSISPSSDTGACDVNDLLDQGVSVPTSFLQQQQYQNPSSPIYKSHAASFTFTNMEMDHQLGGGGEGGGIPGDVTDLEHQIPGSPSPRDNVDVVNTWDAFVDLHTGGGGAAGVMGRRQGRLTYKDLVRKTTVPELFFFDYGVVVMWGLTEEEEDAILNDLRPFEEDGIDTSDVEAEKFHYLYSRQQQARIYNDIITLISPTSSMMIKLTISHAFAQSAKLTLFEGLIEETIEGTRHVPNIMAETGKIHMNRKAINQKIGQLFIMRINVNLVSNVLDTPEIFWSEPALEPLYVAVRGYLEISQRVDVLNQRVGVISDLLAMLKDNLTSTHGEQLEWIVIFLITLEIVIGLITIAIDLSAYLNHLANSPPGNSTISYWL